MTIDILGSKWEVKKKNYNDDKSFEARGICGYCNYWLKLIVYCDTVTRPGWEDMSEAAAKRFEKVTLRHEIIHAFFAESGLMDSAIEVEGAWCENEEMIDWIALKGPAIVKAWQEAGCL